MLIATIIAGLALLFIGGEVLVRGAVLLGLRLGVSSLVVGLAVVGFGTSMPELVTSLQAAWVGSPGIALGSIVGSNIANVLLILGLAALVCPITCPLNTTLRDGGLMMGAALALAGLSMGGALGREDGLFLILGLVLYFWLLWRQEWGAAPEPAPLAGEDVAALRGAVAIEKPGAFALVAEGGLVVVGIIAIVFGGRLLVDGAIKTAAVAGVSETAVGLTLVAVGTSLPELVTSLLAALRRQPGVAYGNIVGSNIFNVLGIGGVTALTVPMQVPHHIVTVDIPVMVAVIVALAVFAATGARLTRGEGAILLAGYGVYLATLSA